MKKSVLVAILGLSIIEVAIYLFLSKHYFYFATDWIYTFYPATVALIHGQNPYSITTLHNPVWALFPLIPLALLGKATGSAILYTLGFSCYALTAFKFRAKPLAVLALLLCPVVILDVVAENVDAWVLLGLAFPAPVGLFFAAIKPQIGVAMAAYWAYAAWKTGGLRKVARTFLPVSLALAASFLIYGNWLVDRSDHVLAAWWNFSLFPWSLPVGAFLLYRAIRKARVSNSIAASPFFSPYVGIWSWGISLVGLLEYEKVLFAITFALWVAVAFILL